MSSRPVICRVSGERMAMAISANLPYGFHTATAARAHQESWHVQSPAAPMTYENLDTGIWLAMIPASLAPWSVAASVGADPAAPWRDGIRRQAGEGDMGSNEQSNQHEAGAGQLATPPITVSRRTFLRAAALGSAALGLLACGPAAPVGPAPAAPTTQA